MIDIELSALFLALKLSKLVEQNRKTGKDDFELFRAFTKAIRDYENKKEK